MISTSPRTTGRRNVRPRAHPLPIPAALIAAEAYAIYQQRGGGHGHELDDWFEAERRLTARAETPD